MVIIYDLKTRDGRRCIEMRTFTELGDGTLYVPAKATVYSISYDSILGRIVAFNRAALWASEHGFLIKQFEDGQKNRSYWQ